MKIIPLGTNGFFPSFGRETACFAIPYKDILILLDTGSGFFRLAEILGRKLLVKAKEVHIFLSHYHLDHTFGFYAAFKILEGKKVVVFAESERQVFSEFINLKYFPINYPQKHQHFRWQQLSEGEQKIASYKLFVKKQQHRFESCLAYKFTFPKKGKKEDLVYLTDSDPKEANLAFVSGAKILLLEHWFSGKNLGENLSWEKQMIDGHATTIGAAMFAKEAKVERLALVHHNPFAERLKLEDQLKLARSIFPKTELAEDLKRIEI